MRGVLSVYMSFISHIMWQNRNEYKLDTICNKYNDTICNMSCVQCGKY